MNLIELIAVLVITAVLAAVALPRLWSSGHDELVFAQEAASALRYAHRTAVAKQRTVCVQLAATTITLRYLTTYGLTNCAVAPTDLPGPGGEAGPYTVNAQHGGTFGTSASFAGLTLNGAGAAFPQTVSFDRLGAPSASVQLTLNNGTLVIVEAGTGYARIQ